MVVYNFKKIAPVPTHKDFVDIVLSRTQRKTPTVVHPGFQITRIREFYMRKVKYTQTTFHDKLSLIVDEFPQLDDIHPFYADLINVLYDRDHYKLALGQVNVARQLIDNIAKDYVKMLKYGDSLFRCKSLKRAAMGRMCTVMRKQGPTLAYLEEVRKHLARLPAIDPATRTLLVTGYPNVGKSSFMNKVTRADVEVQPYAFTTKSLFVGHADYKYQRWQVIDTPGILDHPLEERNTIEMQSITALAHLHAAVLFFVDISGHCGFSIEQQVGLFNNIAPLFANKPLVVVATKIDVQPWETLAPAYKSMIGEMVTRSGALFATMSNMTDEGIAAVKSTACDALLSRRVEAKAKNATKLGAVLNRMTVTEPKPRDGKARGAVVPTTVVAARAAAAAGGAAGGSSSGAGAGDSQYAFMFQGAGAGAGAGRPAGAGMDGDDDDEEGLGYAAQARLTYGATGSNAMVRKWLEKDREAAAGGPGVYRTDTTRYYSLKVADWRSDIIPELLDGKNIADFVDPEIEARLAELEAEEDALVAAAAEEEAAKAAARAAAGTAPSRGRKLTRDGAGAAGMAADGDDGEGEGEVDEALLAQIRTKKKLLQATHHREASKNRAILPRTHVGRAATAEEAREHLSSLGHTGSAIDKMVAHASTTLTGRKRGRSVTRRDGEEAGAGKGKGSSKGPAAGGAGAAAAAGGMDEDAADGPAVKRPRSLSKAREMARSRSRGASPSPGPRSLGIRDESVRAKVRKEIKREQRVKFYGLKSDADRSIPAKMPKHLFSGKRGIGSSDWR